MSEPQQYGIETIADLLAIPADKIEACLIDLAAWVRIMKAAAARPDVFKILDGSADGRCGPGRFVWIDDGEHMAAVRLQTSDGKEVATVRWDVSPEEPGA